MARYVPERGDVVWLDFRPRAGHEQAGPRPALVVSPGIYNRRSGLMLCCPITSRLRRYPFVVPLLGEPDVGGAILADQVRAIDWRARRARKRGRASNRTVQEVIARLHALLS